MATRSTRQGHLRLSLVSRPVALYTGTSSSSEVHFNLLHKETMNRIRMIPTDPETGAVEHLVRGFEVDKGHHVDDRYEEALKALIAEKKQGHKIEKVEEQEDTNVVDLMDALRQSLGQAPAAESRKTAKEPAERRAPDAKKRLA